MHRDRKSIRIVYLAIDVLLIVFSFYLSYCLRYNRSFAFSLNLPHFRDYALLFSLWGIALVFFLHNYRLFSTDRSLTIPRETWRVVKCVFFASVLAGLAVFLLQLKMFSRLVFGGAVFLLVLSLSLWRAVKRALLRYCVARGYHNINVLIVGAGYAGRALAGSIKKYPYLGLRVAGFLDDEKTGRVLDYDVLGSIDMLDAVIRKYFVDEIYVTIPSQRQRVAEILAQARKLNKAVRVLADNFTLLTAIEPEDKNGIEPLAGEFPFRKVRLGHIGVIPLISYIDAGPHGTENALKRAVDILVSGIFLIALAPFFALIAFLIKIDSPGPVFHNSERCGKRGRVFKFYKFRSMVAGAENHKEALRDKSEVKGPIFKIKKDPRTTRFGRLLRRYSLDELPQLLNVLRGEMSLVGPRPQTTDEAGKYEAWQMRRLEVKPGITCLWQVRGRSDLSFYKWMRWDLWYIDNWSLGLDLLILLWTIPAVLKRKGAY